MRRIREKDALDQLSPTRRYIIVRRRIAEDHRRFVVMILQIDVFALYGVYI